MLNIITPSDLARARTSPVSAETLATVAPIVADVRALGEPAARRFAETFRELAPGDPLLLDRDEIAFRARSVPQADFDLLRRAADRITAFALAQRGSIRDFETPIPSGTAGQTLIPVQSAGCYAPGGRYPLPSSVLMTACVARAAGVPRIIVASPKPAPITFAAAVVAGADAMLTIGGAHAIAALAYGLPSLSFAPVDLIAGPGNKFVTAAKKVVFGDVGIDMLAGPSELTILHDTIPASPDTIAADLLAQAEHDDDARAILLTTSPSLAQDVARAFEAQCLALPEPNRATAARAARNSGIILCDSLDHAIALTNDIAPEHLEILTADPQAVASRCLHAGAVFLGEASAEVFGDYGLGPNHTLPTSSSARFSAGLSVLTFLRARTWLRRSPASPESASITDTARFARLESLEAHARAAEQRLPRP
jgi:histidinol dehydrogenase